MGLPKIKFNIASNGLGLLSGARNIKDDNVREVFKSSELSSNQIKEVVKKFLESK